jgi:putative phosphoesterase
MKILLISDTHSNTSDAIRILRADGSFDMFFHMGDTWQDAAGIRNESGVPMRAVSGNMDGLRVGPAVEVFTLEGVRFLLTHGDLFGIHRGLRDLNAEAVRRKADVVCFGHTHAAFDGMFDDRRFINPGAMKHGKKSYGILTVENETIVYEAVTI